MGEGSLHPRPEGRGIRDPPRSQCNKKKLVIDPARREPAETLQAEFEGSISKLRPLRDHIRQTDELIDAVVYELYGLTDEEIKIVEGFHE